MSLDRVQTGVAGVDQHDRAFRDTPVRALMSLDVGGHHKVIHVLCCLLAHVDDNARPDQLAHRQLVGRQRAFGEVDRGVEMGAAMLGRRKVIGGVVVAPVRMARKNGLLIERLRRRPIDRLSVERMGQVDPSTFQSILSPDRRGERQAERGSQNRLPVHEANARIEFWIRTRRQRFGLRSQLPGGIFSQNHQDCLPSHLLPMMLRACWVRRAMVRLACQRTSRWPSFHKLFQRKRLRS